MDLTTINQLIASSGFVLAALIPSIVAAFGVKRAFSKKQLTLELLQAYRDLNFMNCVEENWAALNVDEELGKRGIRDEVSVTLGYDRSRFSASAHVRKRIAMLEAQLK